MARRATNVTRTRIQAVARARFARCDYDATSLHEIAADLDVTKAALYYHFPSKADLLQRLLAGADPGGVGQVRAAAAVGTLTRPVAVLNDVHLGDLRGTILAAALGALGSE